MLNYRFPTGLKNRAKDKIVKPCVSPVGMLYRSDVQDTASRFFQAVPLKADTIRMKLSCRCVHG